MTLPTGDTLDPLTGLARPRAALRRASIRHLRGEPLPGVETIRALRADIVDFCRHAHRLRVRAPVIRRLVGQTVCRALPPDVPLPLVGMWALAARRVVDELYLLGEHRG